MKNQYAVISFVLLILGFVFYWYSYRPEHIRAQCLAEGEFSQQAIATNDDVVRAKIIESYYQTCIHRWGLDK